MIYFSSVTDQTICEGHLGTTFNKENVPAVFYAQADGDELDIARKMFPEINTGIHRVFTYCGVYAQMLLANWK